MPAVKCLMSVSRQVTPCTAKVSFSCSCSSRSVPPVSRTVGRTWAGSDSLGLTLLTPPIRPAPIVVTCPERITSVSRVLSIPLALAMPWTGFCASSFASCERGVDTVPLAGEVSGRVAARIGLLSASCCCGWSSNAGPPSSPVGRRHDERTRGEGLAPGLRRGPASSRADGTGMRRSQADSEVSHNSHRRGINSPGPYRLSSAVLEETVSARRPCMR